METEKTQERAYGVYNYNPLEKQNIRDVVEGAVRMSGLEKKHIVFEFNNLSIRVAPEDTVAAVVNRYVERVSVLNAKKYSR